METKNIVTELPEMAQKLQTIVDSLEAKPQIKTIKPVKIEKPSANKPKN